ncbi:MAG: hypothetical protein Q7R80_03155 [bacterium]|nr:hypothetical protein [bacterium]
MYEYVHSVRIAVNPCNHCDERSEWYLHELKDGSVRLWYEGCGGLMGRAYKERGKTVDRNKAIADLERRICELHEERRELFDNLHGAEKMLKRLRKASEITAE